MITGSRRSRAAKAVWRSCDHGAAVHPATPISWSRFPRPEGQVFQWW